MGEIVALTSGLLKKNLASKKLLLIIFFLSFIMFPYARPIICTAKAHSWRLSPFLYTFLSNDGLANMLILSSSLLLFADFSPSPQLGSSSNHITTVISHIVYILAAALIYIVIALIISIILLLPVINVKTEWDIGWKMLAYSGVYDAYPPLLTLSTALIKNHSASNALLLSVILTWFFLSFLGLISYLFSRALPHKSNVYLIISVIISDTSIYNMLPPYYLKFSPLSLSMLSTYNEEAMSYGITFEYGCLFYLISIPLLISIHLVLAEHQLNHWRHTAHP